MTSCAKSSASAITIFTSHSTALTMPMQGLRLRGMRRKWWQKGLFITRGVLLLRSCGYTGSRREQAAARGARPSHARGFAFSLDAAVAIAIAVSAAFLFTGLYDSPGVSYSQSSAVVEDALFAL